MKTCYCGHSDSCGIKVHKVRKCSLTRRICLHPEYSGTECYSKQCENTEFKVKNKCKVCGKQSVKEYCCRCRKIWKSYIWVRGLHSLPAIRQEEIIRKKIAEGVSL